MIKDKILKQELPKYCKQLGIREYPSLVFTLKEYNESGGNSPVDEKRLGICFKDKKLICVRIDIGDPIETLIHELIHYRFPSMPHGVMFDNYVKQTLEGNKLSLYNGWV